MFGNVKQTVKISGMRCMHCAAHAKEALEKIEGVKKVNVILEKQIAEIVAKPAISAEAAKAAIEGAGYQFLGLE